MPGPRQQRPNTIGPLFDTEFRDLLADIYLWGIYTRSDHRFRCQSCYDLDRGDSKVTCGDCYGTGYRTHLERWKIFPSNSLQRVMAATAPLDQIGWTAEHTQFVFCPGFAMPQVGDLFFVPEWNVSRELAGRVGRPLRLVVGMRVTFVETLDAAQPIYHIGHCDNAQEALDQYARAILPRGDTLTTPRAFFEKVG